MTGLCEDPVCSSCPAEYVDTYLATDLMPGSVDVCVVPVKASLGDAPGKAAARTQGTA